MKLFVFICLAIVLAASVFALDLPPGVQRTLEYQQELALSITLLIAFVGGLLTFTSPCGFVLVPTFIAYVFKEKKNAFVMTLFFSLGLIVAFIIFGLVAGAVGSFFNIYKEFFAMIAGIMLVFFGLLLVLGKGFSLFQFKFRKKPVTGTDTFLLGFFFGVGWTPCVGPILGGVGLLGVYSGSVLGSVRLFVAYALGVVIPLLFVSYWSDKIDLSRFTGKPVSFSLLGKRIETYLAALIGGFMLIVVGLIMFFDKGTRVFMERIPQYVPWRMEFFTTTNEWLVTSSFFKSAVANVIGLVVVIAVLGFIVYQVRKTYKQERRGKPHE
ncbi:cytochrome c biogenesis protein CcdA [Candidatus Woesearchaeota archaeon]|nr:cytochrome c biogenesis protein CcdA [Candidatus Woesearchaeota archaeon]